MLRRKNSRLGIEVKKLKIHHLIFEFKMSKPENSLLEFENL